MFVMTSSRLSSNLMRSTLPNSKKFYEDKVTLRFVVPNGEAAQWQSLIDEFETIHPNLDIDLVNLRDQNAIKPQDPRAVKQQYIDSFTSEIPPYDLVFMDIIWVPEFAEKGWIRELDMKITDPELKEFLSDDINGGIYQEKLYRMPVRSDIGWLYYRTDLLKDAGLKPPETFEELIDISQKLQAQGLRWGYLWQGRQAEALVTVFVEVLRGYGGFWIDLKTLDVGLDRPEAIAAVQFLRNTMFSQNPISPTTLTTYREDETLNLFLDGNAAFLRNWSYVLPKANLDDSDIRNKIGVKPMVHASGYTSGGCQGGWGLGIAEKTQHPKEAWEAVKFFTSEAAQRKLFLASGDGLPTRRKLFKDSQLVKRYSHYPAILDLLKKQKSDPVVSRPAIPQYAEATCTLQKYLHTALTQKENPDIKGKMQTAARETKLLLKTNSMLNEKDCSSNNPIHQGQLFR
jgi:multiple sugar transport system substrate-binding protein